MMLLSIPAFASVHRPISPTMSPSNTTIQNHNHNPKQVFISLGGSAKKPSFINHQSSIINQRWHPSIDHHH